MNNNIYIVCTLLVILIILLIIFIKTFNLEQYKNFSTNLDISGSLMNSYNNMYISACDNECSNHDSIGSCKYFTSTANTNNTIPGTCKLYSSATTPNYMNNQNLYFM